MPEVFANLSLVCFVLMGALLLLLATVLKIESHTSGWKILADAFPGTSKLIGESFIKCPSVKLTTSNGEATRHQTLGDVTVTVAKDGFGLRYDKLSSPFHRPIFIPWSAVSEIQHETVISIPFATFVVASIQAGIWYGGKAAVAACESYDGWKKNSSAAS